MEAFWYTLAPTFLWLLLNDQIRNGIDVCPITKGTKEQPGSSKASKID
jgi:hypothetical protein